MSTRTLIIIGLIVTSLGLWMGFYPQDWQNWLGFSHDAYFKWGTNYAFTSGPGPMMETAIGLTTIIAGLFHHLNCHTTGCWRIVRHKIADGEYGVCGRHWREINGHAPDHKFTIEHLRAHHHAHLTAAGREPASNPPASNPPAFQPMTEPEWLQLKRALDRLFGAGKPDEA